MRTFLAVQGLFLSEVNWWTWPGRPKSVFQRPKRVNPRPNRMRPEGLGASESVQSLFVKLLPFCPSGYHQGPFHTGQLGGRNNLGRSHLPIPNVWREPYHYIRQSMDDDDPLLKQPPKLFNHFLHESMNIEYQKYCTAMPEHGPINAPACLFPSSLAANSEPT